MVALATPRTRSGGPDDAVSFGGEPAVNLVGSVGDYGKSGGLQP
jgi:hypothetical protein